MGSRVPGPSPSETDSLSGSQGVPRHHRPLSPEMPLEGVGGKWTRLVGARPRRSDLGPQSDLFADGLPGSGGLSGALVYRRRHPDDPLQ